MARRPRFSLLSRAVFSAALVAFIAGCASDDGPPPGCPRTNFVSDLDHLTMFTDDAVGDLTDVRFDARLEGLSAVCNFESDAMVMDLAFQVIASRGPANRENQATVTYFVAVADPNGVITAKETFTSTLPFKGNLRRVAITDEIEPRIPYPADPRALNAYRVLIGFQLTPEQLKYNRSRTR